MNGSMHVRVAAVLLCMILVSVASFSQEKGNALEHLQPLVGKAWVCTSWDGEKPKHKQILRWEKILAGNAIRETMEKPEIGFSREGFLYWDAERRQVVSLIVTNNGLIGHATISWENGRIVWLGKMIGPNGGSMEQKESLELLSDERMQITSYKPSDTGWVQRHVLEYTRREGK